MENSDCDARSTRTVRAVAVTMTSSSASPQLDLDPSAAERDTSTVQHRYDRIAPIYDVVESVMELQARRFRQKQWSRVGPGRVLELGAGTGKNLRFYPENRDVVATDISAQMLERARRKAHSGARVRFEHADAQALPYPDASFEVVVATFLFCSVPDPVKGLSEARRVLVPGGQLLLVEHVLTHIPVLRSLMRFFDPVPAKLWGAHIARDTVANVRRAGFINVTDTNLSLDIVKLIEATAPAPSTGSPRVS